MKTNPPINEEQTPAIMTASVGNKDNLRDELSEIFRRMAVKGMLSIIYLDRIERRSKLHGYALMYETNRLFHVRFGPSTAYPILNHLEDAGLLKSSVEYPEKDYTPRKYSKPLIIHPRKTYVLTPLGGQVLRDCRDEIFMMISKIKPRQSAIDRWYERAAEHMHLD